MTIDDVPFFYLFRILGYLRAIILYIGHFFGFSQNMSAIFSRVLELD